MEKEFKQQLLGNLIWNSDLSDSTRNELMLYVKELQDNTKFEDAKSFVKTILFHDLIAFSKANNVLPFEYPTWVEKAEEIFEFNG